jgi:glycosyltransferase involved in cell wall biosynthesis
MRITSDIQGLGTVASPDLTVVEISASAVPGRWKRNYRLLASAMRSRHLVIHFHLPEVMFFSALLFLNPFNRCQITTLDFFAGDLQRWIRPFAEWSLKRVARFLVYFKDAAATARTFHLPSAKFHYIPFKINGYERIRDAPSRDEGYIFSGGRSRRDFATLFAAVESLGYPVKVLTGREADLLPHGSSLQNLAVPPNVEILHNDDDMETFVRLLTGARLVVIPILRDSTTQAGIGVYLQAMAAGKCLIISSGLGVSDVISSSQAVFFPAGDAEALREAIRQAWEDPRLRESYGQKARDYALPLGGEDELRRSILRSLPAGV